MKRLYWYKKYLCYTIHDIITADITGGYNMAKQDTVNKVKSLLEGHCYGPLREAAEKWLNAADEKYDIKDKADKAWDKLNDAADKYSDASAKFSEKMSGVSENLGEAYDKAVESEFIKQLKEGVSSVGDLLETFGAKDAADKFGGEFAEKMKSHAENLKEKGEKFCDCDACVKARSILKDLGEDLDEIKDKAADKFTELKEKAEAAEGKAEEAAEEVEEAVDEITE